MENNEVQLDKGKLYSETFIREEALFFGVKSTNRACFL